jgi:preprotein translocase subunit YajC
MPGDIWSTVLLFALMGGVLYFLMIRPQQKRTKEQQSLMSALEPGSRVMLISGIVATIRYLGEKQAVVEIAPGVEMTVDKRAISTQAVVDEFEYADEDDQADEAEPADAVAADAPVETAVADAPAETAATDAPVTEATDAAGDDAEDAAWDNPGTTKN